MKTVADHKGELVEALALYVQWRAGRAGKSEDASFADNLLATFGVFLDREGIAPSTAIHAKLIEEVGSFAGQVPPGGPPNKGG